MKRYSINLYFGFERLWCFVVAANVYEAQAKAQSWAACYAIAPDSITVQLIEVL